MPLLDALLAFALIIFTVSMVVTVIVQIIVDLGQLRARHFKNMLTTYYRDVAIPFLRDELGEAFDPSGTLQDFHWIVGRGGPPNEKSKKDFPALSRDLVHIDAGTFTAHLKRSPLGKDIENAAAAAGAKAEEIFAQLTDRFEIVGHRATERFRRTTRSLAIVMGVVVAFSANVDSIHVLDALMGNPAVTAALVDPKNPTLFELKKVSERLTKLQSMAVTKDDLGKIQKAIDSGPPGKTTITALTKIAKKLNALTEQMGEADNNRKTIVEALGELEAKAKGQEPVAVKKLIAQLQNIHDKILLPPNGLVIEEIQSIDRVLATVEFGIESGFPVGWNHFPGEGCESELDLRCKDRSAGAWLTWIAGLLITAFLAGLGAPFWHDLFTSVALAMKVVKERAAAKG